MARLWLTPRWLIGHVLVLLVVALFVNLGLWQLRRLDERRAYNVLVAERMSAAEQPLDEALAAAPGLDATEYRLVSAAGEYAADEELLLGPLSRDGEPGYHVLTPLVTGDGSAVLVDRGWVPFAYDEPPVDAAAPPRGQIGVSGLARASQQQAALGPRIPDGELTAVGRVDIERIQQQISAPLLPAWIQLQSQEPAQPGPLPLPARPPELAEANHLSYAVQWFLFAAIGLVGYGALLRKAAADARPGDDEADAPVTAESSAR